MLMAWRRAARFTYEEPRGRAVAEVPAALAVGRRGRGRSTMSYPGLTCVVMRTDRDVAVAAHGGPAGTCQYVAATPERTHLPRARSA
jgi:hypothetical protein